ncbi:Uncharacterised protein [Vibrio cholerae]|nr:Uncharacterised protein [Vibrio cholerae]CSB34372.1 Uncharacterised protein [Vibrio cholerae]CSC03122.1 Uncharacterised protein [Vibrio cholerae]CSC90561.1 Uncharacterised protein [Vibrio cholerae]
MLAFKLVIKRQQKVVHTSHFHLNIPSTSRHTRTQSSMNNFLIGRSIDASRHHFDPMPMITRVVEAIILAFRFFLF